MGYERGVSLLEIVFERKAMKVFKEIPLSYWFMKTEHSSIRALPDRIGVIAGTFVALEFKKDRDSWTAKKGREKLQAHELNKIKKAGGFAEFIYPENYEEIFKKLKELTDGI